jgi:hypothetical protein
LHWLKHRRIQTCWSFPQQLVFLKQVYRRHSHQNTIFTCTALTCTSTKRIF